MKLLLDEDLAPRLARALAVVYAGTAHVVDCGLSATADEQIWQYARQGGYAIVSKDGDFRDRSAAEGPPPKLIWLRLGNASTSEIETVLLNHADTIEEFLESSERACLVVTRRAAGPLF
jgi:predicted nuclease of predicted toxin-antitoxin system